MPISAAPVAVVAGASRGLGLLIARELAERGHRVAICARDDAELAGARSILAAEGHDIRTDVCDVRDPDAVAAWVAVVEGELGPVAVAIHVAGVIQVGPLETMDRDHFAQSIDIMLWGPIHLALAVLPGMRARGEGRIGIISSIAGRVSAPHLVPYSTAKFGAAGFSDGLRAELAGSGVTATTITPGLMRTGSHLRADFTGDQACEYLWFATSNTAPLLSIDARRAARRIVRGVLAGRRQVVLTPAAQVAMRLHGLAPGLTGAAIGLSAKLLPRAPDGERGTVDGRMARRYLGSKVVNALTVLGERAAERNNEDPDGPPMARA